VYERRCFEVVPCPVGPGVVCSPGRGTASKPAIIQVLAGEGTFGLGADVHEVATGSWAHMAPNLPYTVSARTPMVLLLTMIKAPRG